MLIFAALLAVHASFAGTLPAAPENITVTFLNPNSVRVSWQTTVDVQTNPVEKYDVTYRPTDARVVAVVAGNSEAVTLHGLSPDTQYQLTVSAIWSGKKYRSRPIVFRTLEHPRSSPQHDSSGVAAIGGGGNGPPMTPHAESGQGLGIYTEDVVSLINNINSTNNTTTRELPTIRGVEVGIVVLVLIVWAGAIALFFNRWGKIRMLLPYQPDYKQEQLKVPGTGVCTSGACNGQHSHQKSDGSQAGPVFGSPTNHFHYIQDEPSTTIAERCTRSRINSAIFVSSEGRGFDSIEFLRRHGSQSVLCRKARSAENLSDEDRKRQFSNQQWGTEDSSHPSETIEMAECHSQPPGLLAGCHGTAAAVSATASTLAAAIAIVAPSIVAADKTKFPNCAAITSANSSSIVGSISIEPAPQPPTRPATPTSSIPVAVSIPVPPPPPMNQHMLQKYHKSLSHQSETSISPSSNPIVLNLKNSTVPKTVASRPKLTTNLPMLSVSGPSPPHQEEFL